MVTWWVKRLLREIRDLGYTGCYSIVTDVLRAARPPRRKVFERRFETPPGRQAQVDFVQFRVEFTDREEDQRASQWEDRRRTGGRASSDMTVHDGARAQPLALGAVLRHPGSADRDAQPYRRLRGHARAPSELLNDRMKTAVIGEDADGIVTYNSSLVAPLNHYGALPRACRPYPAKTKGKVERPYRYVRQDFFLAPTFMARSQRSRRSTACSPRSEPLSAIGPRTMASAVRESRRIGVALKTARLTPPKTLESFDFAFQPSLDRNRILALAQLEFVARAEVVHFLGPPGTGKSHLASALGVAAVKAGKSVYRCTLAELVEALGRAEREGRLIEKTRFLSRNSLLIDDEIGYLPISPGGANLFFQLVNARYEKSAFAMGLGPMAAPWLTPDLQPWLCRVGRSLRRSGRRNRAARSPAPPCRRRPDRRRELPPARARRSHPGIRPRPCRHRTAAAAKAPRATTQKRRRQSLIPADRRNPKPGNFTSALGVRPSDWTGF